MEAQHPRHEAGVHPCLEAQPVVHGNAFDDKRAAVQFDLTDCLRLETTVSSGNAPGFQGAPECADQSTGGSRHHIVEGGGVRLVGSGPGAVVLGDLGVHSENHRRVLRRQVGVPQGSLVPFDGDPGSIDDLTHGAPFLLVPVFVLAVASPSVEPYLSTLPWRRSPAGGCPAYLTRQRTFGRDSGKLPRRCDRRNWHRMPAGVDDPQSLVLVQGVVPSSTCQSVEPGAVGFSISTAARGIGPRSP